MIRHTLKHSPGPWSITAHTAESPSEITPGCDWSVTAHDGSTVCFEGNRNERAAANAALIAAAPDLLDALQTIARMSNDGYAIRVAEEALAKAGEKS